MKMKAAVCREQGKPLTIEEVELAQPKEREVLVKTRYTGYCHSDWSALAGWYTFPLPFVPGHEAAGVVVEVGPGVTSLQKGDHVVTSWAVPCGKCELCVTGRENICPEHRDFIVKGTLLDGTSRLTDSKGIVLGHQTFVSGFAEYMVVPEAGAIKMPKEFPLEQAALLACCLPTGFGAVFNTANVKPGNSVAVWGMGGIGLNVVQGAKLRGADPIIAIDLEASKESIARRFGATHFINSSQTDPIPLVQELTSGGAHFVFEASGDTGAITQAYWALRTGGKQIQIGIHSMYENTQLSLSLTPLHNRDIIGCLYGAVHPKTDLPALAKMVMAGGYADLNELITKRFRLVDLNDVFEAMKKRQIVGRWVCEFD